MRTEIIRQIILAVEFLAKQGLAFRGHRDDRVDFSSYEINRGNFVALLQLQAKGNDPLQEHLLSSSRQARYTSKTIQNDVIHMYASKIKERLTAELRTKDLPFVTIGFRSLHWNFRKTYKRGEISSVEST